MQKQTSKFKNEVSFFDLLNPALSNSLVNLIVKQ